MFCGEKIRSETECDESDQAKPDCHEDARGGMRSESSVNSSAVGDGLEETIEEGNKGVPDVSRPCCEESESVAAELYKDCSLWGRSEGIKGEESGRRVFRVGEARATFFD